MGIDFSRIINNVKQTIQDTRGNMQVSKEHLYNHYLNKLTNVQLDYDFFLNKHDYEIVAQYNSSLNNKDTKKFVNLYIEMYEKIVKHFNDIPSSNLMYFYQNHYNRLKVLNNVKTSHLEIPTHIEEIENELYGTIYNTKNIMFFMFGTLRQVLQNSSEVLVLESYCEPQQGFRKLESLLELPIVDKEGYKHYIESQVNTIEEQYNQLSQLIHLIKEQINVLLLYYQQFDNDFTSKCVNEVNNPYASNMNYNYQLENSVDRAEELKHLQNIMKGKG